MVSAGSNSITGYSGTIKSLKGPQLLAVILKGSYER